MSSGSGSGCPAMNRGLRCAQTWRTREKEMDEEGETDELNEMSLLLKGLGGGGEEEIQGFLTGAERHLCGAVWLHLLQ